METENLIVQINQFIWSFFSPVFWIMFKTAVALILWNTLIINGPRHWSSLGERCLQTFDTHSRDKASQHIFPPSARSQPGES